MLDFLGTLQRTHTCGELRSEHAGGTVTLMGWVNRRRDHGNLIFLDLRDRSGIAQIVLDKDKTPEGHAKGEQVRPEYVVAIIGKVRLRAANVINPKMATGEIEIVADQMLVLNDSKLPPFSPAEDSIDNEEVRLKYRFLDLRRPEMQRNMMLRHDITLAIRQYLSGEGFLEIETPILTRSTPEGARDYLVPSRVHAGEFFALPQSPQIFKQILMISGLDRYFQIARCFRDEDLRADRQPEFTQVDLEMSFPQQESIHRVTEGFLAAAFRVAGIELALPFPRMTFDDAIRQYGIDKPDLRLPPLTEVSAAFTPENLDTLGIAAGLPLVAVRTPGVGELSRKERDDLRLVYPAKLAQNRVKVYDDFKRLEKSFPEAIARVRELTGAEANDYIVFAGADGTSGAQFGDGVEGQRLPSGEEVSSSYLTGVGAAGNLSRSVLTGRERTVFEMAGLVRLALAAKFAERHKAFDKKGNSDDYKFLWVTDFPFFEWDEEKRAWTFAHHPFTSPHEDDLRAGRMESDPGAVRALAYDVVLNGTELGSGSIRIHRQDVQQQIFRSLGMTAEETKARFGFFLEALEYGTPPHGGIALGLDRIAMILAGAQSLREVIAFPKTAKAIDLMMDAPTTVSDAQLRDLHIRTVLKS
ncbi:MAG TPA: aspartate--tRNA ligase [Acidisarcina sp.]